MHPRLHPWDESLGAGVLGCRLTRYSVSVKWGVDLWQYSAIDQQRDVDQHPVSGVD